MSKTKKLIIHRIQYINILRETDHIYFTTKAKATKYYKELLSTDYKPSIVGDFDNSYKEIEVR